jgi:hypothetical protein
MEVENIINLRDRVFQSIILFCLSLIFYPTIRGFCLGQIQVWINTIFTICIWLWITGRKKETGFLIGVMCLIKPQYSLIFIWAIFRRQWGFVKRFAIILIIGLSLSIVIFGIENNLDYIRVLSFISKHGEGFHPNQSINGFLNRLLFNGDNLDFSLNSFPPFNIVVYIGTITTSLILILYALFRPLKSLLIASSVDFFIICITATIASPIAWEHHYGIILGIYAFLFPPLLKTNCLNNSLLFLGLSYILSSQYFPIIDALTYNTMFNFLQSYLLVGGLMLLTYLYWIESNQLKTTIFENSIDK